MITTDESEIGASDGGIINVKVYRNEDSHSRTANGIRCRLTHNGSLPKILDIICEEFLHGAVWAYPNNGWVLTSSDSSERPTLEYQLDRNTLTSFWKTHDLWLLLDKGYGAWSLRSFPISVG